VDGSRPWWRVLRDSPRSWLKPPAGDDWPSPLTLKNQGVPGRAMSAGYGSEDGKAARPRDDLAPPVSARVLRCGSAAMVESRVPERGVAPGRADGPAISRYSVHQGRQGHGGTGERCDETPAGLAPVGAGAGRDRCWRLALRVRVRVRCGVMVSVG